MNNNKYYTLQQHLPFTVLKLAKLKPAFLLSSNALQQHLPFTVLKLVLSASIAVSRIFALVATALTVHGIETLTIDWYCNLIARLLQQHLPFTVLKLFLFLYVLVRAHGCNSTYRSRY